MYLKIKNILWTSLCALVLLGCNDEAKKDQTDSHILTSEKTTKPAPKEVPNNQLLNAENKPVYTIAEGLVLKSNFNWKPEDYLKISSKSQFETLFEKSDNVDFEKQYVIAVVLSDSLAASDVLPVNLIKVDTEIILNYEVHANPNKKNGNFLVLVLDKSNDGNVRAIQVKTGSGK